MRLGGGLDDFHCPLIEAFPGGFRCHECGAVNLRRHSQHEFTGSRLFWFDALRLTVVQEVLNGCLEFAAYFRDGFPVETDDGANTEHPADEDIVPFVVFDAGGVAFVLHEVFAWPQLMITLRGASR